MNYFVRGMSLVELMLALLLGTLVVATAIGVFIANRQTMTTTQEIARIQHNMQVALELLARDLRQAGANPCSRSLPFANIIGVPASRWWTNLASTKMTDDIWSTPWRSTLRGLTLAEFADTSTAGGRVAGSDAIELLSTDTKVATVVSHDGTRFVLNNSGHGFSSGNLLLVCDSRQASLFQAQVSGIDVLHPAGGANCGGYLGLPGGCDAEPFTYMSHALMARWKPVRWYLGHNGRDGTSLYQMTLDGNGQGVTRQEMVEDVSALEFRYLLAGAPEYVKLAAVSGRWDEVIGVRISLSVSAAGGETGNGDLLTRTAAQMVNLRNRNP